MNEMPTWRSFWGFPSVGKLRIFLHQGGFVKRRGASGHRQLDGLVPTAQGEVDGDGDGHQGQEGQDQHGAPQLLEWR